MLRSAATLNRTEVQPSREMKQVTTRQHFPTPPASGRPCAHLSNPKIQPQLPIDVRLFKD
jgi:hypothetical protein